MADKYFSFSKSAHEQAEKIINQEVLANQTNMVNRLMELVAIRSMEEEHIYQENGLSDFKLENVENLEDYCLESIEAYLADTLDMSIDEMLELAACDREELALKHGYRHEEKEIYEWWLVSPYIAEKLAYHHEAILRTGFGTYWGRACTGQSIIADGIFQLLIEWFCTAR